jgi:hypothetical protein
VPWASRSWAPGYPPRTHVVDDVLRSESVISIVPAAPLEPTTAAVRLAAGHDRVEVTVVEVVDDALLVVPGVEPLDVGPDEWELQPATASAPARPRADSGARLRS